VNGRSVRVFYPPGKGLPLVVFLQGFTAYNAYDPYLTDIASYGYIVADPKMDNASVSVTTFIDQEVAITPAIIQYMNGTYHGGNVDASRICVMGHSAGAAATMLYIISNSSVANCAISLAGGPEGYLDRIHNGTKTVPFMLIDGSNDDPLGVKAWADLLNGAHEEYWIMPGAYHDMGIEQMFFGDPTHCYPSVLNHTLSFLAAYIGYRSSSGAEPAPTQSSDIAVPASGAALLAFASVAPLLRGKRD
jgi:predicted esterase